MYRTAAFTKKKTSGHEPQLGLDTKTDRLTDRQLQHDFDFAEQNVIGSVRDGEK
jgi:hypothetical protein